MAADPSAGRLAPAKVNLTLQLCGQRADGYHLLDSTVVFPSVGDLISVEAASVLSLSVSGPFGDGISTGADNLVLKAAEILSQRAGVMAGAALHLEKNLPVASGIGGGSSDAAATLMLLSEMWDVQAGLETALEIGADVPVCCAAPAAQRMQGIGEILSPAPVMPEFWIVLVNPGICVPTGAVFSGVADKNPPRAPGPPANGFSDFAGLAAWLETQRNDLQSAAVAICPPVGDVLSALSPAPVSRMSGSGATCFALFETRSAAERLADNLRASEPWWVAVAPVSGHS
jgi:4-diphosphocytidyl-2-C-methyl-D-erythritol kinase